MPVPALDNLNELTLGSLLRRVTDQLYSAIDDAYKDNGFDIQGAWFPVLHVLSIDEPLAVTEIAERIGQSHSAVSQISKRLEEHGLLQHTVSSDDRRQRLLSLSDEGHRTTKELKPVWSAIVNVLARYIAETQHDLLGALRGFEETLAGHDFVTDIRESAKQRRGDSVEILDYRAEFKQAFHDLNTEWLQKYFYVEAADEHSLSSPEEHIIKPGGAVFYARHAGQIVGTSALISHGEGVYEVSKMAVTANCQGLGIGRRLLLHSITRYHQFGGTRLFLESSSRLVPALHLYESEGFVPERRPNPSPYRRSDVYMVYKGTAMTGEFQQLGSDTD